MCRATSFCCSFTNNSIFLCSSTNFLSRVTDCFHYLLTIWWPTWSSNTSLLNSSSLFEGSFVCLCKPFFQNHFVSSLKDIFPLRSNTAYGIVYITSAKGVLAFGDSNYGSTNADICSILILTLTTCTSGISRCCCPGNELKREYKNCQVPGYG